MNRYGRISTKRKREIVLLRGRGCAYGRCAFCDYHLDRCPDDMQNFELNRQALSDVTGMFGELEVINSGSVFELDRDTLALIKSVCIEKKISVLHFEAHYLYREKIEKLREDFAPINLKMKLGLETFDFDLRETVLKKGIPVKNPDEICKGFDEANFLFGIKGQSAVSMLEDIRLGLDRLERVCVNIMCENSTEIKPDAEAISQFMEKVYPLYADDPRVDILINNTDFGVGD